MQKKRYSSPEIELVEFLLSDTILVSITPPTVTNDDEYGLDPLGRRKPSMKDELEGDDLFEIEEK